MSEMFEAGERNFMAALEEKIRVLRNDLTEAKMLLASCIGELDIVEYENDPPERILEILKAGRLILKKDIS
jgi:hypothetical protein